MPNRLQQAFNRIKKPFVRKNKYKKLKESHVSQENIFNPFEEWTNKQLESNPIPKDNETYRQYVNPDFQSGSGRRRRHHLKRRKPKKSKKNLKRKRYSKRLRRKNTKLIKG